MNLFFRLKIRRILLISFGSLIGIVIIIAIINAYNLIRVTEGFSNLTDSTLKRQTNIADMLGTLATLNLDNVSKANSFSDNEVSSALYRFQRMDHDNQVDLFFLHLTSYRDNVKNDTHLTETQVEQRITKIDNVDEIFVNSFYQSHQVITEGVANRDFELTSIGLEDSYNSYTMITSILNDLRRMEVVYFEEESVVVSDFARTTIITQIVTSAAVLGAMIFISIQTANAIVYPLQKLGDAASAIADGDLNQPIRNDLPNEIGELSNHIGEMVDSLKQANQAKSDFLANMSHEMRTPLNVIVGTSNLWAEKSNVPEDMVSDLSNIKQAGMALLGIVNDILDLSKIESGKFILFNQKYDVAKMISEVSSLYKFRFKETKLDFILLIQSPLPCFVTGDELRVKQVLNNLLSNAFKYSHEGSVTLSMSATVLEEGQTQFLFKVKDTGIGIKQEDLDHLFQQYSQVDTKTNRLREGTGLGLSITKELVESMGGRISVESTYGVGSTFTATIVQTNPSVENIPKKVVQQLEQFQFSRLINQGVKRFERPDLHDYSVLVVDDFQTNLDIAKAMLEKYKLQVTCVLSGEEAVKLVQSEEKKFSAIFMDHMMPVMDGLMTTKKIREINTTYAITVPIIALTANAIIGNEEMFLANGFQAFVSKPIDLQKLDNIIRTWIVKEAKS